MEEGCVDPIEDRIGNVSAAEALVRPASGVRNRIVLNTNW
jgi:hypothetical protein